MALCLRRAVGFCFTWIALQYLIYHSVVFGLLCGHPVIAVAVSLYLIKVNQTESTSTETKEKIVKHEADIAEYRKKWEAKYDSLFEKIEGLLPGATSIGLSKAYQEQVAKYKQLYNLWSALFIVIMICLGCSFMTDILSLSKSFNRFPTFLETVNLILERAPIFVPSIWLAIFVSKQQSQKLRKEYVYKETLAKSYESYK